MKLNEFINRLNELAEVDGRDASLIEVVSQGDEYGFMDEADPEIYQTVSTDFINMETPKVGTQVIKIY